MILPQPTKRQRLTFDTGFTAVELLITLFIAAVFITTGYQLYAVIVNDGSSARLQAKANNIAYEYLANYSAAVPVTCSTSTATPAPPVGSDVPALSITVNTTCPYGVGATLSRVEVIVSYGTSSPQQQVSSVVYATN